MQTEIVRKGGWLSREGGDIRNMKRARLSSAVSGAIGAGNQQEVWAE